MAAADFRLIPARPSPADIEAAALTLTAVRESGSRSLSCSIRSRPAAPA